MFMTALRCRATPLFMMTLLVTFATGLSHASTQAVASLPVSGAGGFQISASRLGDVYAVSDSGGANSFGQIYRIAPDGTSQKITDFTEKSECAGDHSPLVENSDGFLYGASMCTGDVAFDGRIYRISPDGVLNDVFVFNGANGRYPTGLSLAADGNFYGTTRLGGAYGQGTVFRLTPGGALTTIYNFQATEGHYPLAPVYASADGLLYGTTNEGGTGATGTAFKLTTSGVLTTLGNFDASASPLYPNGLVQGADGLLYGTTQYGGIGPYTGTLFAVNPAGGLTTVLEFNGTTEGGLPFGQLVAGADGSLYGTTSCGLGCSEPYGGVVFQYFPNGAFRSLGVFPRSGTMANPGAVVMAADGKLYGGADTPINRLEIFRVPDQLLAPPINVSAQVVDTTVSLSWLSVAGAQGYKVYMSVFSFPPVADPPLVATVSTTQATVTGLQNNKIYSFKVATFDDTGTGTMSGTDVRTPAAPSSP